MFDSDISMMIAFKTKIDGKRRECLLFRYDDGSCRILCKKRHWFHYWVEEIYRTEDGLESGFKIFEILSSALDKSNKTYKITNIWERNN